MLSYSVQVPFHLREKGREKRNDVGAERKMTMETETKKREVLAVLSMCVFNSYNCPSSCKSLHASIRTLSNLVHFVRYF